MRKLIISSLFALSIFPQIAAAKIPFKGAQSYPVGTAPLAIAAADFNGDGKIDLAVANSGTQSADDGGISILLGNGDGTFQPARNLSAGQNPGCVAAGDLNGDGRADLLVTDSDGVVGQVGVLLGNGDGTFQPIVDYAVGNTPNSIHLGNFNADPFPDAVVTNTADGTISVLLSNGDGSFQTHLDYRTGGRPQSIALADFNGDGSTDLAVACAFGGSSVAILIGNGDGTFHPSVPYDAGSAFGPRAVSVADFNNDGRPDVIVDFLVGVGGVPPTVQRRLDLLTGNGDGTFELVKGVVSSVDSELLAVADFDGDGRSDVALNGLLFLPGNGDGTFQAPISFPLTPVGVLFSTDLNDDKAPDLVVVDRANNALAVVLNVGTDFSISASSASPSSIGPNQSATSTLSLNLLNAFNDPVSLSCSVQPAQAGAPSCLITPSSLTFDGNGEATAQLTLTAAPSAISRTQPSTCPGSQPWNLPWLPIVGLAFAGVGLVQPNSRRKKHFRALAGSLVFAALFLLPACSGGNANSGPQNATYTATVTAVSGSTQHAATVQVTVQ